MQGRRKRASPRAPVGDVAGRAAGDALPQDVVTLSAGKPSAAKRAARPAASRPPRPRRKSARVEAPRRRADWAALHARLDALVETFGPEHLTPDPLEVVRRFRDPRDVEIAGFVAAALAFGSALGARRSAEDLLARVAPDCLGAAPPGTLAAAVRAWSFEDGRTQLRGWRHRWLAAGDASAMLTILGAALRSHGSLEAFFAAGDAAAGDAPSAADSGDVAARTSGSRRAARDTPDDASEPMRHALASFVSRALALAPPDAPPRVAYWFSGPSGGGPAKRLCLWLRWMCRRDQLDPGPWTSPGPARLVIPLDVHVARIARYVGLLRRRTSDWRAAAEITARLRTFAPADPVRYDYAVCRLGVLGTCPRRRERRQCAACPLFEVCLL